MVGEPGPRVARKALDEPDGTGTGGIESGKGLGKVLETTARPTGFGGFYSPRAVEAALDDRGFAGLAPVRLTGVDCAGKPREQKPLRQGHVFDALQDRPARRARLPQSQVAIYARNGRVKSVTPSLHALQNLPAVGVHHTEASVTPITLQHFRVAEVAGLAGLFGFVAGDAAAHGEVFLAIETVALGHVAVTVFALIALL